VPTLNWLNTLLPVMTFRVASSLTKMPMKPKLGGGAGAGSRSTKLLWTKLFSERSKNIPIPMPLVNAGVVHAVTEDHVSVGFFRSHTIQASPG
jgi:hypothetical protein